MAGEARHRIPHAEVFQARLNSRRGLSLSDK